MAAQWRAVDAGIEQITEGLLRSAYRDNFRLVNRILETLKSGDPELFAHLQDVYPPLLLHVEQVPEQSTPDSKSAKHEKANSTESNEVKGEGVESSEILSTTAKDISTKNQDISVATISKLRNSRKKNNDKFESDDLRGIVERGQVIKPPVSAYQSLLEKGCIRSANEYL